MQVLTEPKVCQRQWHTITAIPTNKSGSSVSVVVIGGVPVRDKPMDPTKWPKAENNFVMEFGKLLFNSKHNYHLNVNLFGQIYHFTKMGSN